MFIRAALVCTCVLWVSSAAAEELGPDQARAFIVGKLFEYSCFDGTTGRGRMLPDGSVVGTYPSARSKSGATCRNCRLGRSERMALRFAPIWPACRSRLASRCRKSTTEVFVDE